MARWISQPVQLHGAWSLLVDTARTYGPSFGNLFSSKAIHIAGLWAWPLYWSLGGLGCGCCRTPSDERLSSRTVSVSLPLYHKTVVLPYLRRWFFWAVSLIPIVDTLSSVHQSLVMLPTRNNPEGIVSPRLWIMHLPPHSPRLKRDGCRSWIGL